MIFLLVRCFNGVSHTLGIVTGETPEAAAQKLGAKVEGHMSKWDGLGVYYLRGKPRTPQYILEHWNEIESFPESETREHGAVFTE